MRAKLQELQKLGVPATRIHYEVFGSSQAAAAWLALSPNIVTDLRQLGFTGPIVTDALQTPAVNKLMTTGNAAVQAVIAGDDLVLAAGSTDDHADTDGASTAAFSALVAAARSGRLSQRTLASAYTRVIALKAAL